MIRFQYFDYFWLLLIVPVLIIVFLIFIRWRKIKMQRLGDARLVNRLIEGRIDGRNTTKFVLGILSVTLLVFALANLQKSDSMQTAERKGTDIMFALDVSKSMLAQDVQPNRLSRAKLLIQQVIEKLKSDRVGLIVFAGNAYLQIPFTTDYAAAKMLLESVSPDMIPAQGTEISKAIEMSLESFGQTTRKHRTLFIISDGEGHDEGAIKMAQIAGREGVTIHTIGIGSPEGTTIYDPQTGQDKVDNEGNLVITKLNEDLLKEISQQTSGTYHLFANNNKANHHLLQIIEAEEGETISKQLYIDYKSYFQYFLLAALLLLLVSWLLPTAKVTVPKKVR